MHKCPWINVLNIEMEPRMGDGDNRTMESYGTLNQWKICISGFLSAERSPFVQFSELSIGSVSLSPSLCSI